MLPFRLNKHFLKIPLFFSLIIGLWLIFFPIFQGIFAFTFDQARDLLWVKNQLDFKQPALIGPWGSLQGVYFGPLWYWLLSLPFLLSNGSPIIITSFNALVVLSSFIFLALALAKHNRSVSYFLLFLGFLSPAFHWLSQYAFAQHLLPLLTAVLILAFAQLLTKFSLRYFLIACFTVSLMFHAEPPVAVFSLLPLAIISFLSLRKTKHCNLKTFFQGFLTFLIPFAPLILFDLRHQFIQAKAILGYLLGQNQSLGDILPFASRLIDRPLKLLTAYQSTIINGPFWLALITLFFTFFLIQTYLKPGFLQKLFNSSLIYLLSLWFIFTLYPPEFKPFYLDGFKIIFLFWVALALGLSWKQSKLRPFIVSFLILAFFINIKPNYQLQLLKTNFADSLKDTSVYQNQKNIIDYIYQDAQGQGFKVYTYAPAVYDYPYQYLFFYHGLGHYDYLPEDFSYLPDQPEYVQKKTQQLQSLADKIKSSQNLTYLIIEPDSHPTRQQDWLKHFSAANFNQTQEQVFPDQTRVKRLERLK